MWIALAVAACFAVFLLFVSRKSSSFRWERHTTIAAPPAKIFPLINHFHAWREWSPWEGLDPNLVRTYSGPDHGVGAVYAWEGNKKVGKGRMEITDSAEPTRVRINLDFIAPFEAHNVAEFTLSPEGAGTRVNWVMTGPTPFMNKLIGIFMNFEAMVMKDFEKGLAQLKAAAER
ncbi:MAG: SRPBCC family protein [Vicinamibacterales bacterium]